MLPRDLKFWIYGELYRVVSEEKDPAERKIAERIFDGFRARIRDEEQRQRDELAEIALIEREIAEAEMAETTEMQKL